MPVCKLCGGLSSNVQISAKLIGLSLLGQCCEANLTFAKERERKEFRGPLDGSSIGKDC